MSLSIMPKFPKLAKFRMIILTHMPDFTVFASTNSVEEKGMSGLK